MFSEFTAISTVETTGGVFGGENFSEKFSVKFSVKGKQLERLISILTIIVQRRILKIPYIATEVGVSVRTLYEDINKLRKWGIVRFEGAPKTGRYMLTENGRNLLEKT